MKMATRGPLLSSSAKSRLNLEWDNYSSKMMPSTDSDRRSPSQRLPVNPRRHKVAPEQRKRVATACNNCNVRRIKCSGEKPCKQCSSSSRECIYPVPNDKISVSRAELEDLRRKLNVYERLLQESIPDVNRREEAFNIFASTSSSEPRAIHPNSSPGSSSSAATTTATGASLFSPFSSSSGGFPSSAGGLSFGIDSQTTTTASTAMSSVGTFIKSESMDDDALRLTIEGTLLREESVAGDSMTRYHGETSEACFLDHMKHLVSSTTTSSSSSSSLAPVGPMLSLGGHPLTTGTFSTQDSQPFPDLDVSPLWLPSPPNMAAMLSTLRSILQDGGINPSPVGPSSLSSPSSSASPSGGIMYLADLSTLPVRQPPSNPTQPNLGEYRHLAFYHAAFALTCHVTNAKSHDFYSAATMVNGVPASISEAFFARAASLLTTDPNAEDTDELDHPFSGHASTAGTTSDAATFAMMGLYALETNRPEMARTYVSAALRICEMLGLHRVWLLDEKCKRVFWTIYILDRWISLLLGRPVSIPDESITIPLPAEDVSMPAADGLSANVELARIAGRVISVSAATAITLSEIDTLLAALRRWSATLPPSLQLINDTSPDPAVCALHMQHNHLVTLLLRPMLLNLTKQALLDRSSSSAPSSIHLVKPAYMPYVDNCVAAARHCILLARHVLAITRRKLLRTGLSQLYTAAMVLMLAKAFTGESATSSEGREAQTQVERDEDVEFVVEVFQRVAGTGEAYGADCVEVLKALQSSFQSFQGVQVVAQGTHAGQRDMFMGDEVMGGWMEGDWYGP